MEKKAKVLKREFYKENNYQGKIQYAFFITFEGDDKKYLYNSKEREPKYFKEGEEQEYVYEHKTGTNQEGKPWEIHIVKPVYPKPAFGKGGFQQMTIEEYIQRQKVDSVGYALSYAKDLSVAKIIEPTKVTELAKTWLEWMHMQYDKILLKENK